jgi:hypothetical protein
MTPAPSARLLASTPLIVALAAWSAHARAADPTMSDCLAANENAGKLQADKKLRQAREQAAMCAAETCPAELHNTCRQRVSDLNRSIPTVVFQAKAPNGADVTNVKVSIDGQPLVERLEGTAISVDPGSHTFHFEAAGWAPIDKSLIVLEGQKDRVESVVFGGTAAPTPAPTPPDAAAPPASPQPVPPGGDGGAGGGGWSTQKYLAVGVAGLGLVGIVVGSIEGASASSSWNNAQNACPSAGCAQHAQAVTDHDNASNAATVSTISFVAGGVLLAGGATWFFLAPSGGGASTTGSTAASLQVTPSVGPGGGGFSMRGSF